MKMKEHKELQKRYALADKLAVKMEFFLNNRHRFLTEKKEKYEVVRELGAITIRKVIEKEIMPIELTESELTHVKNRLKLD